jgi:hypothetical protein
MELVSELANEWFDIDLFELDDHVHVECGSWLAADRTRQGAADQIAEPAAFQRAGDPHRNGDGVGDQRQKPERPPASG